MSCNEGDIVVFLPQYEINLINFLLFKVKNFKVEKSNFYKIRC